MWRKPLIPALRRQRQVDRYEFQASLVYGASPRTGSKAAENPYLEKQKTKQNKTKNPNNISGRQ